MHREIVALRYALWDYYELALAYTPPSRRVNAYSPFRGEGLILCRFLSKLTLSRCRFLFLKVIEETFSSIEYFLVNWILEL